MKRVIVILAALIITTSCTSKMEADSSATINNREAYNGLQEMETRMYGEITEQDVRCILRQAWNTLDNYGLTLENYDVRSELTPENLFELTHELTDCRSLRYQLPDGFALYVFSSKETTGYLIDKE